MDPEVRTYIAEQLSGVSPTDYGGRRADAPSALLSRAARRQRLSIQNVQGNLYVLGRGSRTVGGFEINQTSLASEQARLSASDIDLGKRFLKSAGIAVPRGRAFSPQQGEEAQSYLKSLNRPAVVKPASGQSGAGVSLGVTAESDVEAAWNLALQARQLGTPDASDQVVIEEQCSGIDLRAFVVGENVVSALVRLPLFGVGDGKRTTDQIFRAAEEARSLHPLFGRFAPDLLVPSKEHGGTADEVSRTGEIYQFSAGVNMRLGGVTVDVTAGLGSALRELAIESCWAVPGCRAAAVDLLVPDLESTDGAHVLHVNTRASFAVHHYPWIGRGRPVADSLVQGMISRSGA